MVVLGTGLILISLFVLVCALLLVGLVWFDCVYLFLVLLGGLLACLVVIV